MEVLDATHLAERLKEEANEMWLHVEAESPFEKYPAKQHARRVQEKLGVEAGLIYLPGQELKTFEDSDMPRPFHQRRYFYYLSGCNEPDCHLAYDIRHDILTLFIPRTDERRAIYNGPGLTLAQALIMFDVDEVYFADELKDFIVDWSHASKRATLYALHPSQVPSGLRHVPNLKIGVNDESLQPAMNIARMIKDDHEIKLIRKANDISSQAHREVLANIIKFKNEAQVEGLFRDVCVSQQAKQQAYDPIAASGPNAGTLHYDANNEDFGDRQLMCLDAGCEYQLYASDITRSFPLSGSWPSKEAEKIYKLVERMQESCIERIAPGVRYMDLHILAHQIAIDGLLELGILHNGTKEEIYKAGTSKAFFLHGLGHHIGLDVHDVGQAELMSVRRGKPVLQQAPSLYPENFHLPVYDPRTCHAPADPLSSHLEEGMVVTVEPGIYFSVYALQHVYLPSPIHSKYINLEVLKRYMPVGGVRIEDDILVTSKGYENLSTAPKGDAMLRIIQSGESTADRAWTKKYPARRRNSEEDTPLLRAPGILSEEPTSILHPLSRATTLPKEFRQRDKVDFEPFQGPSLFSNFKRSMTTDERIRHWQMSRNSTVGQQAPEAIIHSKTICGDLSTNVAHVHMTTNQQTDPTMRSSRQGRALPSCRKCTMLCETLDRLRGHLNMSERSLSQSPPQNRPRENPDSTFITASRPEDMISRRHPVALKKEMISDSQKEAAYRTRNVAREKDLPMRTKSAALPAQLHNRHSVATFPAQAVIKFPSGTRKGFHSGQSDTTNFFAKDWESRRDGPHDGDRPGKIVLVSELPYRRTATTEAVLGRQSIPGDDGTQQPYLTRYGPAYV